MLKPSRQLLNLVPLINWPHSLNMLCPFLYVSIIKRVVWSSNFWNIWNTHARLICTIGFRYFNILGTYYLPTYIVLMTYTCVDKCNNFVWCLFLLFGVFLKWCSGQMHIFLFIIKIHPNTEIRDWNLSPS